jgi:hypothetical protein
MTIPNVQATVPEDQINQASDRTVDGDGFLDDEEVVEPKIFGEDGSPVSNKLVPDTATTVDIIASEQKAKTSVLKPLKE